MYYTCDLRAHFDIIYEVLTIEDSWQEARLLYALKGIPMSNETTINGNPSSPVITIIDGVSTSSSATTLNNNYHDISQSLFDIFSKSKSTYQKRAYYFVKMLLRLFTK
jgi:hypothetical protein